MCAVLSPEALDPRPNTQIRALKPPFPESYNALQDPICSLARVCRVHRVHRVNLIPYTTRMDHIPQKHPGEVPAKRNNVEA